MKIETIKAREILDSRGNPTVEVYSILVLWGELRFLLALRQECMKPLN